LKTLVNALLRAGHIEDSVGEDIVTSIVTAQTSTAANVWAAFLSHIVMREPKDAKMQDVGGICDAKLSIRS